MTKQEWDRIKDDLEDRYGLNFLVTNQWISDYLITPSPATLSLFRRLLGPSGALGRAYASIGLPIEVFSPDDYLLCIAGRAYLNLRIEEDFLFSKLGMKYYSKSGEVELREGSRSASHFIHRQQYLRKIRSHNAAFEGSLTEANKDLSDIRVGNYRDDYNFSILDDALQALEDELEALQAVFEKVFKYRLLNDMYREDVASRVDAGLLRFLESTQEYYTYGNKMIPVHKSDSNEHYYLEAYGHLSHGQDFELASERYAENPTKLIDDLVPDENELSQYAQATQEPPVLIKEVKDKDLRSVIMLNKMRSIIDNMHYHAIKRIANIRYILISTEKLLELNHSIFQHSLKEVLDSPKQILAHRDAAEMVVTYLPTVITTRTKLPGNSSDHIASSFIYAEPVSYGVVQGVLKFVSDVGASVESDEIIVVSDQSIDRLAQYRNCAGVIFTSGMVTSSGAYICRSINKPAVVTDKVSTLQAWEGQKVSIDPNLKRVIKVEN